MYIHIYIYIIERERDRERERELGCRPRRRSRSAAAWPRRGRALSALSSGCPDAAQLYPRSHRRVTASPPWPGCPAWLA